MLCAVTIALVTNGETYSCNSDGNLCGPEGPSGQLWSEANDKLPMALPPPPPPPPPMTVPPTPTPPQPEPLMATPHVGFVSASSNQ